MTTVKLAGAAWSFVGASLSESAAIWQALGIEAMDLMARARRAARFARDRTRSGGASPPRNRGRSSRSAICSTSSGMDSTTGRSIRSMESVRRPPTGKRSSRYSSSAKPHVFRRCWCCRALTRRASPTKRRWNLSAAADERTRRAWPRPRMCCFLFEPHVESVLESPFETLTFLQQNPALKIVLDYSHFMAKGYGPGRRGSPRPLCRPCPSAACLPR